MINWKFFCVDLDLIMLFWREKIKIEFDKFSNSILLKIDKHVDDLLHKSTGQTFDILSIQICSRLVECQNARVEAKGFGQGQSNDYAGEHFLTGAATPAHVQDGVTFDQNNPIVVRAPGL
jgi:hypothetical protein